MKIEIGLSNGENITFNEFYSNPYVILTPKNPNNALIWSCSVVNITPSSATISCYYLGNNGEWIKYNDGIQYIAIGYMK